jgi:hypothetical protein
MKTLKYEEVHRSENRDLAEARISLAEFLEKVYNQKLLHSALGYPRGHPQRRPLENHPSAGGKAN